MGTTLNVIVEPDTVYVLGEIIVPAAVISIIEFAVVGTICILIVDPGVGTAKEYAV